MNKDIVNCQLDTLERIRQMRAKNESPDYIKKAEQEMQKLRLQKIIMEAKEDMFHKNLTKRTLNRQKFINKVQKLYPETADELIEYYDRQVFQQTARR